MISVRFRQMLVLFIFAAAAAMSRADVNVLIIGSDTPGDQDYATILGNTPTPAFQYEEMANHLQQILEGAGHGTVNVTARNRVAGSTSSSSYSTTCNNLATWFYWPYGEWEGYDAEKGWYNSVTGTDVMRWADLRNEGDTQWDYVVLIGDPYTIETIPGYYTLGVAKIAEEVAKGTGKTLLLMPWPADGSSTNLNHYKEVVYRSGRTASVPVAPAGLAWQAAGSPAGANHPSADGAYIAAATLYSRMFGQSATNSAYNPNPSLAEAAQATVAANQGAPQYSGTFEFNNPFAMLGDKRRRVYHTERGTSTESRLQRWLTLDILPDLNVASSAADNNYDSNTPDDDGLGWSSSWPMPAAFNYGRHRASAGDGSTKSYFTNRDFWQLGFGFAYQSTNDKEEAVGRMSNRDLWLAYLMKEGTTSYTSYNLSAYDRQEEIASARLIPLHTLYAIIKRDYPDQNPMADQSHQNRGTGRAGSTLMYTLYSGRTPIEEELAPTGDPSWITDLEYNNYVQYVGYETAWILGNVQARAPGLKVTPSTSNASAASETFSVRFFFPPQEDVTVTISVSDPSLAEVSQTNLVFTPQNYSNAVAITVRALQRNTGGDETYDVQFTTSSNDEVYDGLNDSWSFTLPDNAAPSVAITSPTDGAVFPNGDLTVTADASDPDGSVSSVTLWLNGQQVRQDTTAPYQWSVGDGDSLLANLADDFYELKVAAIDNQGEVFTKTISVTVGAPEAVAPAVPIGVTASPLYSSVELDWNDNTEGDFESYTVYRSESAGNPGNAVATGLSTSDYTDDSVVNGITYYYSVTAVDVFTNESAHSVQRFAMPGTGSIVNRFGTDFQGLAGFTTSPAGGTESWTTTTDSVHYAFGVVGTDEAHTASLLKSYSLNRSVDASYTFEGVVDLTDGYGDDNNRIGILLFNDTDTQTSDGGGGLYLQLNTDGGGVAIVDGITGSGLASTTATGSYSGDSWIGTTLKFTADLVFANIGGTDKIDISFTLTDEDEHTDILTAQVNAADYTGTYFGFATKWRQRGELSDPTKNVPADFDYRSFRFTEATTVDVPTGLAVIAGDGQVSLDWDDSTDSDVDSYSVYRSTVPGSYSNALAPGLLTNDYTDVSVINGTTYYYVITAVDDGVAESAPSTEASATPAAASEPPVAPTGLQAEAGNGSVHLVWDDNVEADLDSYSVYRSTTSGSYSNALAPEVSVSEYTDQSAVNGVTYYYVVTATDAGVNESEYSAEVSATPIDVPEGLTKFGLAYDGSGDFTKAVTANAGLSWSDTTDSLQLSQVAGNGLNNSSALTQLDLDRSVGSEYQFTMVFSWDVGYAGNNNRFGIQMFADDSDVAGEEEGIVAHWNVAQSQWTVGGGVNNYLYTTGGGGGPTASFNADEYTIDGTVSFLADDVLNAEFSIIAPDTTTYTIGGDFTASAMTGDWFGLVGRNRTTGGALEINVKSFRFVEVAATNEPGLSDYEQWADDNGITGGPDDDDDGDGISNLREYAFGAAGTTGPTLPVFSKSGNAFTYVYPELAAADAGITYTVQVTTNLVTGPWVDLPQGSVETGDPLNTVTVNVDTVQGEKFIRVKIEQE